MDLQTEVAGIKLEHPLMNAAGTCKSLEDVKRLVQAPTAAVTIGSGTLLERSGNEGEVYWFGGFYSLNSLGLPNRGAPYYRVVLPEMVKIAHDHGKPLFWSAAGFSPVEYADLLEMGFEAGVDLGELNLGCPNVWQGASQKPIACFNPDLVGEIQLQVERRVGADAKIAAKVSPFSNPLELVKLAVVIASSRLVKVVTTTNTFPNAFAFNGGDPAISVGDGLAGYAGPGLKPISLGQVKQLRALLPNRQVIGVGGINHGRDIQEFQRAGAVATQIATAYLERHEQVFSTLLMEYEEMGS